MTFALLLRCSLRQQRLLPRCSNRTNAGFAAVGFRWDFGTRSLLYSDGDFRLSGINDRQDQWGHGWSWLLRTSSKRPTSALRQAGRAGEGRGLYLPS
jgi:hypothetical protein